MAIGASLTSAGKYLHSRIIVPPYFTMYTKVLCCCYVCAAGILSLLKETEDEIKTFALRRLDQLVNVFWAEIAESISAMYVHPLPPLPTHTHTFTNTYSHSERNYLKEKTSLRGSWHV